MEYLTVDEASFYLHVPRSVIYSSWRNMGGNKVGRHIRIPREKIDDYMARKEDGEVVCPDNAQGRVPHDGTGIRRQGNGRACSRAFEEAIAAGEIPKELGSKKLQGLLSGIS